MTRAPTRTGIVVAGHGRHYLVEDAQGHRTVCHPRGKRSDCVVGDRVQWHPLHQEGGGDEGVIDAVEARRNLLYRQDEWRQKAFAANLDLLVLWLAVEPVFSEALLARALIAASHARIEARIVLNKTDLPDAPEQTARLGAYEAMGYEVMRVSLRAGPADTTATLKPWLQDRTTLVIGPSGTGKSTLINTLVPDAQAQIGELSAALNAGRHTTTSTRWYWLDAPHRSALIDTPGFQVFGLHHVPASELVAHMPDLRAHAGQCRFHNCTHRQEPGCGVHAALARGEISPSRHRIYLELYEELGRTRW